MSAPLSPEIRALLARCMSQIELEWGTPDAELRAVLGVPLDAPIGTSPPEPGEQTLLPCPFCGANPYGEPYTGVQLLAIEYAGGTHLVKCYTCGVEGRRFDAPKDAIAAWNRRHPGDALRSGDTTVNEARAVRGLPPLEAEPIALHLPRDAVADLVESFEEVNVRNHQPGGRKSAIIRHPWQACAACGPWRHFDARAIAATPQDVAALISRAESRDFEEAHVVVAERCVPWVLTPGQVGQLLAAGAKPC